MAKANEEAEEAATKADEKPAKRPQKNGVTRPANDTKTGRVWEIADALSETAGEPVGRKAVLDAYIGEGGNAATGATQYGRWRTYHGLKKAVKAPKDAAAADDGAEVEE